MKKIYFTFLLFGSMALAANKANATSSCPSCKEMDGLRAQLYATKPFSTDDKVIEKREKLLDQAADYVVDLAEKRKGVFADEEAAHLSRFLAVIVDYDTEEGTVASFLEALGGKKDSFFTLLHHLQDSHKVDAATVEKVIQALAISEDNDENNPDSSDEKKN